MADENKSTKQDQEMAARNIDGMEGFVGWITFIALIGADLLISAKASIRVAGVACVVTGILWMFRRSVPVGIEDRQPSFYLKGWTAFFAGLFMAIVGVGFLAYSARIACVLGWAAVSEC